MLAAEDVSFTVGAHTLLQEVTLALNPGEVLGLIGPNGAGKSTLANLLAGLTTPTSGSVVLEASPTMTCSMLPRRLTKMPTWRCISATARRATWG